MGKKRRLPIGVENFAEICSEDIYYVDKTGFMKELWVNKGKVNLFTRPRRFGKTLNMSMLRHFFEVGCDKTLFENLQIAKDRTFCEACRGQFPVISISLKGVQALSYETARGMLARTINEETERISKNMQPDKCSEKQKSILKDFQDIKMDEGSLMDSLRALSSIMQQYYEKKVIILIDEYDVPLNSAYENGYYDQMVSLLRNFLSQALKTNDNLEFAVLTGCLRVAKESIFTGLNNFKIFSITDVSCARWFGFTGQEVQKMLEYYGISQHYDSVRKWYDGYRFGDQELYCPWDVICYCSDLLTNPAIQPRDYWINTSGNAIVQRFVTLADRTTQREIEALIAGESITKNIRLDLTYGELYDSIENLWSILFATGYLTLRGDANGHELSLAIPNLEVRDIFITQIKEWFREVTYQDKPRLDSFCQAFRRGDAKAVEEQFRSYLVRTISIRDTTTKSKKENFYHGILLGLLAYDRDWVVSSNAESGDGYSDILIEIEEEDTGIIIEIKYAENADLNAACQAAMAQIKERDYSERLRREGITKVIAFGIACYKKRCRVVCENISFL